MLAVDRQIYELVLTYNFTTVSIVETSSSIFPKQSRFVYDVIKRASKFCKHCKVKVKGSMH